MLEFDKSVPIGYAIIEFQKTYQRFPLDTIEFKNSDSYKNRKIKESDLRKIKFNWSVKEDNFLNGTESLILSVNNNRERGEDMNTFIRSRLEINTSDLQKSQDNPARRGS